MDLRVVDSAAFASGRRAIYDCRSTSGSATRSSRLHEDDGISGRCLDDPAPRIRAYPHEAVVAEKLAAPWSISGERNSRYKDFYDSSPSARTSRFRSDSRPSVIAETFERRRRDSIAGAEPASRSRPLLSEPKRAATGNGYLTRDVTARWRARTSPPTR